jgi:ribose-phosphate pyrophosphokinase
MSEPARIWSPRNSRRLRAASETMRLFALHATAELGSKVSEALGQPLEPHEEQTFEDGEQQARPLALVDETDVYVVQSLHNGPHESTHDKLCRLLFFIAALKDAGARRVTAVTPYLCYARQDRRTAPFAPVTSRYVAELFEAAGADTVATLEVHNPSAFENAFRHRTVTLSATPLYLDYLERFRGERLCVVCPDAGGMKRAELLRETLERATGRSISMAFAEKHRHAGHVSGHLFVGDVQGATALVVDDLVCTGTTLVRAAKAARQAGADRVIALTAHGLFTPGAGEVLADPAIERVAVTDSVPPFRLAHAPAKDKLDLLASAPLFAETIRRLHEGRPLTDLLVW